LNIENHQDVLNLYNKKDSRYIYIDKNLDNKGIDYTKYLKLRFSSVNNLHIKDKISINGWYVLFYLMSNAQQGLYIVTTLDFISIDLSMKIINIKEILLHLHKENIIYIKDKLNNINKNDRIQIVINYNDNNLYTKYIDDEIAFNPIPIEFVQTVLPNLTPNQWAIYTTLCVYFNYFSIKESYNDQGDKIYILSENCYAFPTQEKLSEVIGLNFKTIKSNIDKLCESTFNLVSERESFGDKYTHFKNKNNGKINIKKLNKTYNVLLYQRVEYVYHCIIQMQDNRDNKIKQLIKTKGFTKIANSSDYKILRDRDYIISKYGEIIKQYAKCIEDEDIEFYKKIRNEKIQP
jgi:chorismate mutase